MQAVIIPLLYDVGNIPDFKIRLKRFSSEYFMNSELVFIISLRILPRPAAFLFLSFLIALAISSIDIGLSNSDWKWLLFSKRFLSSSTFMY